MAICGYTMTVEEQPEQLVKIAAIGIKDGNEVIIGRERIQP